MSDYSDEIAFMNEPVTVVAGNRNVLPIIEMHINPLTPTHERMFILAETPKEIARKWVELLLRLKVLPIHILRDDNPRGKDWLRGICDDLKAKDHGN